MLGGRILAKKTPLERGSFKCFFLLDDRTGNKLRVIELNLTTFIAGDGVIIDSS